MPNSFRAGIHPADQKLHSQNAAIGEMPAPAKVLIPLSQHIGKPARAVVGVGSAVKAGEMIGMADGPVSANIFASVSGKVTEILPMVTPTGRCEHIVIASDGLNESVSLKPLGENPTPSEIIDRIREAGIVGMGGAGFPTAVKLSAKEKIDSYLINGAECEPYISCDYRIMSEYSEQFLRGCLLLSYAAGAQRTVIAVEENKTDAAEKLRKKIAEKNLCVEVVTVKTKYPQGAEKQLVYASLGRKIAPGKLPASVGTIVSNVHTALSVFLAVTEGQPLYRRVMSVCGGGVIQPANLWVANGTPYADVIQFTGGYDQEKTVKLLCGGPMMGTAVDNLDYVTMKTTNCILFLTEQEAFTRNPMPCIRCGKCVRVCPMRLMPVFIDAYALAGDIPSAVKYGARNCMDCGCCTYTCPAKRPLVQSIRLAKKKDAEGRAKKGGQAK